MTRKEFKELANLVIELNVNFPFSGEIVSFVEERIVKLVKKQPNFSWLKWDRYIKIQISKKMVNKELTNMRSLR